MTTLTFLEVCRAIVAEHSAKQIRVAREQPQPEQADLASVRYEVRDLFTGKRRNGELYRAERPAAHGWVIVDAFSASAVVQVHDALNETNRAKLLNHRPVNVCGLAFKVINSAGRKAS